MVSGAAPSTAEVVYDVAQQHGGDVQIELSEGWTWEQAARWREIGIDQAIIHRSRDAEAQGELAWGSADLDNIRRLADMGYRVTVAGSVGVDDVATFAGIPVYIFISGRAIRNAPDPAAAAAAFQEAIQRSLRRERREA